MLQFDEEKKKRSHSFTYYYVSNPITLIKITKKEQSIKNLGESTSLVYKKKKILEYRICKFLSERVFFSFERSPHT